MCARAHMPLAHPPVQMEPELVELHTSRGYETDSSKALMRVSVLFMDLLLFVPGVWAFCRRFYQARSDAAQLLAFVMICMQPARSCARAFGGSGCGGVAVVVVVGLVTEGGGRRGGSCARIAFGGSFRVVAVMVVVVVVEDGGRSGRSCACREVLLR